MKEEQKTITSGIKKWKHRLRAFRNKYILTLTIFTFFALFLDENDIFSLISQNRKLGKIQADQQLVETKLKETRTILKQLKHGAALERYAREEKLFKKDDEDIFILSFE